MQQLVGMSMAFGQSTARAFDVGTGPGMSTVEEQHARPDVHRLLVAPREIVIESREEELLDTRIAIADGTWVEAVAVVGACGIGHQVREHFGARQGARAGL